MFNKQTIRELVQRYGLNRKTIKAALAHPPFVARSHKPRPVHLVVDCTFLGKRGTATAWGVILFRDAIAKENLYWSKVYDERLEHYLCGRQELERLGYTIKSVTSDGFRGLPRVFQGIPFQHCHFHAIQSVVRYLTKKPQTVAGQVLLALVKTLPHTNKDDFTNRLMRYWYTYYQFIHEKTIDPYNTRKWTYTHRRLRSALHSLRLTLPYLFTYEQDQAIPTTTNTCDGHFSHIKDLLRVHRGLRQQLKYQIIHTILLSSSINPNKRKP